MTVSNVEANSLTPSEHQVQLRRAVIGFGTYHSAYAIAIYIAVCAVITLVATSLMTDYTGKDISAEYRSR